jgi:hypothetical protein
VKARKMKLILLSLSIVTLMLLAGISATNPNYAFLTVAACETGIVNKAALESFTVEITFKNTGKTQGTWSINIVFEGEKWTWTGTPQNLTLKPDDSKKLIWNGNVPANAPIDSVARLVVYYGDSFTALNWWIHVVPAAELSITSSTVK